MSDIALNEQECQQDILIRIHHWLNILEQRITTLLHAHDPQALKPGECEQAISRHLVLMLRLLQLRQQYVKVQSLSSEQIALDAFMHELDDEE